VPDSKEEEEVDFPISPTAQTDKIMPAMARVNYSEQMTIASPVNSVQKELDLQASEELIFDETQASIEMSFVDPAKLRNAEGCWPRTKLFTGYAYQDIGRNKCHFCLAFCSVFVVVVSILVVQTITQAGPLAFFSLGQNYYGQIDMIVSPANHPVSDSSSYVNWFN
jgi:hypothetical protein